MTGLIQGTCTQNTSVLRPWIWWEATENAGLGTSTLSVRVIVDHKVSGTDAKITWRATIRSPKIKVNGTTYTFSEVISDNNNPQNAGDISLWTYSAAQSPTGYRAQLILEQTGLTVTHGQDGTAQLALSAECTLGSSGFGPGKISINPDEEINVTLTQSDPPEPDEPGGVYGVSFILSGGSAAVAWSAASGSVTGYKVERQIRDVDGTAGAWTTATTTAQLSVEEDLIGTVGMRAGESIRYRVTAMNGDTPGSGTETGYQFLGGGVYVEGDFGSSLIGGSRGTGVYIGTAGGEIKQSKTALQKG